MHLVGTEDIKDVIAFPKTQIGSDLMTGAPSPVTDDQLSEVHIKSTWIPPQAVTCGAIGVALSHQKKVQDHSENRSGWSPYTSSFIVL
jgi:hypothetical protein